MGSAALAAAVRTGWLARRVAQATLDRHDVCADELFDSRCIYPAGGARGGNSLKCALRRWKNLEQIPWCESSPSASTDSAGFLRDSQVQVRGFKCVWSGKVHRWSEADRTDVRWRSTASFIHLHRSGRAEA
jgi:hypothetical protein